MRNFLYIIIVLLALTACSKAKKQETPKGQQSAEYALDDQGVYKGTYPCADCSGIEVSLILNEDKTFRYETVYAGKADAAFTSEGNYTIKDHILTIQEEGKPLHFLTGKNELTLLGSDMKPNTGSLKALYQLKKQQKFSYQGVYETYHEEKGNYTQTLSIIPKGEQYEIIFSSSPVKDQENCRFSGIGMLKKDTLWVNIAGKKDLAKNEAVLMYIAPSHDNLGVDVFTEKFDERFAMMQYCGGGGSLAGKYLKNRVAANSIGAYTNQNTIAEVLQTIPNAQINKKVEHGEFADDVYSNYEISSPDSQLLFTLSPKDTGKVNQKINRVLINSPFFKTEKGISKNSTYADIKKAYPITKIEPTEGHIVLTVNEIHASFSIAKSKLSKDWWNAKTKSVNTNSIPLNAKIDDFILWWKD